MTDVLADFCSGVADDLLWLAFLHDQELSVQRLAQLTAQETRVELSLKLSSEMGSQALSVVTECLEDMHQVSADVLDEHAADFAAIYLNFGYDISPNESVWVDEDGLIMQEAMFQIRQWYEHYGWEAADWRIRSEDHLVYQLQFIATLFELQSLDELADVARFMDEHILRWIMDFGQRIASRAGTPFYSGLAMLTSTYLNELRDVLVTILGEPRPTADEIDERMQARTRSVAEEAVRFVPGSAPTW